MVQIYENIQNLVHKEFNSRGIPFIGYDKVIHEKEEFEASASQLYNELDQVTSDIKLGLITKVMLIFTPDEYMKDQVMLKRLAQKNSQYAKECRRLDERVNTYSKAMNTYLDAKHGIEYDLDSTSEQMIILKKGYLTGMKQDLELKEELGNAYEGEDFMKVRVLRPRISENEKNIHWVREESNDTSHRQLILEKSHGVVDLMLGVYTVLSDGYTQLRRENEELFYQSTKLADLLKTSKGVTYLKNDFEAFRQKKNKERESLEKSIGITSSSIDETCRNIIGAFTEGSPFKSLSNSLTRSSDQIQVEAVRIAKESMKRTQGKMTGLF